MKTNLPVQWLLETVFGECDKLIVTVRCVLPHVNLSKFIFVYNRKNSIMSLESNPTKVDEAVGFFL